jgi:GMP synthase (glutamine-hydrolysing)
MIQHSSVIVLQHVACETLGTIERALSARGLTPRYVRIDAGEVVPRELGEAGGLIVMGGPMSVYERDRLLHLQEEMTLIQSALDAGRPVLGVCLGSQLLAQTLGGEVRPGERKELGWHRVRLTTAAQDDPLWHGAPAEFIGFHWHGDVYDLPPGAVPLAASDQTACQAFRWGRSAYGVLFHMEVDASLVDAMATTFADELAQTGSDLATIRSGAQQHLAALQSVGKRFFDRWAELAHQVSVAKT